MKYKKNSVFTGSCFALAFSVLTACGGGDSGETTLPEKQEITYQALSSFTEVNEGDTVTLSLNTIGAGASAIKFKWEVYENISFTGQGTDTISFLAPEVDQLKAISVSVDIDKSSGSVVGFNRQHATVNVLNVETLADNQNVDQSSTLLEVDNLDLSKITDISSWLQKQTSHSLTVNELGNPRTVDTKLHNLIYIESVNNSQQSLTVSACGLIDDEQFSINDFGAHVDCGDEESVLRYSQSDSEFALERFCGENLVLSSNFKKVSDEKLTKNGEVFVDFESYDDIEEGTEACGIVSTSEVKDFDQSGLVTGSTRASYIRVFTEYAGNPFELSFLVDKFPETGFSFLDSFFGSNYGKVVTEVLPDISNIEKNESGTITFSFQSSSKKVDAEFEFEVESVNGGREKIEGTIKLNFE